MSRFYEALKQHDAGAVCELVSPAVARDIRAGSATCPDALRAFFRRVATGPDPGYFESLPEVKAALVNGDTATVVVRRGPQRRRVSLARVGEGWRITGSPDFQ